jgi:predicted  nucleic acid-binding Zn-ribbon protein
VEDRKVGRQIAEVRVGVPLPILAHYDRLRQHGKKGIAAVRGQICTGCHMQVPRATVVYLMQGTDIQLCGNCGAYLYLPETMPAESPAPRLPGKAPRKSRGARELAHAA